MADDTSKAPVDKEAGDPEAGTPPQVGGERGRWLDDLIKRLDDGDEEGEGLSLTSAEDLEFQEDTAVSGQDPLLSDDLASPPALPGEEAIAVSEELDLEMDGSILLSEADGTEITEIQLEDIQEVRPVPPPLPRRSTSTELAILGAPAGEETETETPPRRPASAERSPLPTALSDGSEGVPPRRPASAELAMSLTSTAEPTEDQRALDGEPGPSPAVSSPPDPDGERPARESHPSLELALFVGEEMMLPEGLVDDEEDAEVPSPLDQALLRAEANDQERIEEDLTRELEAEEDKSRKAVLQHELGHHLYSRQRSEARAVKAYAQALNLDPMFRPNILAIRHIFFAREMWPNLLKLLDAEARIEEDVRRKAEVLLEKGWILQDKLDDAVAAMECYWSAHEAHPSWLAPLLALEKLALARMDTATLARVLEGLAACAVDPERQAAALLDLARLQESLTDGTPRRALELLERARALTPSRVDVLQEMERLASSAGLARELVDVQRQRAAEALKQDPSDRRAAAARLRVGAQIAAERLSDQELALALLTEALEILPEEKLLHLDLLALAETRADHQLCGKILQAGLERTEDPTERAILHYRLGLARLAAGQTDEAQEALDEALKLLPGFLPVLAEQERRLLAAGESERLTELYLAEAEAVVGRSPGLPQAEDAAADWAASALWRAGVLQHWHLAQLDRAIESQRRALAILPGFLPSLEELEILLQRAGRHAELAALLEERLAATTDDPDQTAFRLETLLALYGGVLTDAEREFACLQRLLQARPGDPRLLRRQLHALERLGRFEELAAVLQGLEASDGEHRIRWKLARAHLCERHLGQPGQAITLLREILDLAPDHAFAFTALEALLRREGRHEDLATILRQAADQHPPTPEGEERRIQLLRELGSLQARVLQAPRRALEVYAEILALRPDDRAAQQDLAQAARLAGDEVKLAEALEALAQGTEDPAARARFLLQLAEVLEDKLSDPDRAEEVVAQAIDICPDTEEMIDAVEVLFRRRLARGDHEEALAALIRLEAIAPESMAPLLLEERAWILAGPLDRPEEGASLWERVLQTSGDLPRALLARGRIAAQERRVELLADTASRLAEQVSDRRVKVILQLRAGVFYTICRESERAITAFRQALQLATEGQPAGAPLAAEALEALHGLMTQRSVDADEQVDLLARLAETVPERGREDLRLALALTCERAGRWREAAMELVALLEREPDHLPALVLLQRIGEASGEPELEARAWVRLGKLLTDRNAKIEAFGRAAKLLLGLSRPEQSAVLYRHVLALRPADDEAFDRLRQLYERAGDHQGMDELLGIRLASTEDRGQLIALRLERATLRLEQLGDPMGGVRDLLHVVRLDPKHPDAIHRLARLYDEDGNVPRALELYQRFLDVTDGVALKRPVVLQMSRLLDQQEGRPEAAVEILRRFLEHSPEDDQVLEHVAELHIRLRDVPHAVSALERLGNLREDRPWKARNLQRIAALYREAQGDLSEARATLMRARDIDPTNLEIIADLRQLCRQMDQAEDVKRVLARAKDDMREALATSPLSVDLYARLMQVAEWAEDEYALLSAMGVLCYFNAAESEDRELYRRRIAKMTFEPKHQVGAQAWREALVASGARSAYGEIWSLIAESIPRLFEGRVPGDPATFGVGRADRVDRKAGGPVSSTIDRIASAFGLVDFDIYLCSKTADIVAGVTAERPALVVGHAVVTTMDATARFRIGRMLSLLKERALALEILKLAELELLLSAAIFGVQPDASFFLPRAQVEAESRRLQRVLPRRVRKSMPLAVARFMQEGGNLESWIGGVIATANRAGLLVCGDVLVAMDQLVENLQGIALEKRATAEVVRVLSRAPQAAELLVFSVGGRYLNLRRELRL